MVIELHVTTTIDSARPMLSLATIVLFTMNLWPDVRHKTGMRIEFTNGCQ